MGEIKYTRKLNEPNLKDFSPVTREGVREFYLNTLGRSHPIVIFW